MKKLCLIAGLPALALMMCVFVQSCAQTEDHQSEQSIALTEADLVVASPEYQAYLHAMISHSMHFENSYDNLSAEDQKKFDELWASYNNDSPEEILIEASRVLKYNIQGGFDLIEDLRSKVNFGEGVSSEDMTRAIARNSHLAMTHTRATDPTEQPGGGSNPELDACINGCFFGQPEGTLTPEQQKVFLDCLKQCKKKYGE